MLKDLWLVLRGRLSSSQLHFRYQREAEMQATILGMRRELDLYKGVLARGMGRILAKLDPAFAQDPHDPKVKAESDRLGEEVIRRLKSEVQVQRNIP